MLDGVGELSVAQARQRLGLEADAPLSALQGAFQAALKTARGSDDRRFEVWPSHIELTPTEAILGGMKVGRLPTGRPFETKIPPALRDGDLVWVWGWLLQARIDEGEDLAVRGDDIWVTARKHPAQLKPGARIAVETPLGPCSFRLSPEAIEAGLVRAPGLGLPPSRGHAQGDLYVRLVADKRVNLAAEMIKRLAYGHAA